MVDDAIKESNPIKISVEDLVLSIAPQAASFVPDACRQACIQDAMDTIMNT